METDGVSDNVALGSGEAGGGVAPALQWATRLIDSARAVSSFVRRTALVFAGSALVVWSAPALPFETLASVWGWVWRLLLLAVLALPAVIVFFFGYGLNSLAGLSPKLLQQAVEGKEIAAGAVRGVTQADKSWAKRVFGLLGSLWQIGRSSMDAKDTVLGGMALVRLFNPAVVALIFVGALFGVFIAVLAAVRAIWWVFA